MLQGIRLFDGLVRSLSRKLINALPRLGFRFFSFLLNLQRPMMLAGLRCAGAGGGGPGSNPRDGTSIGLDADTM
ncbi:MAG: hypothetical protein ACR2QF_09470 [Geminicoccaceae bacterium]